MDSREKAPPIAFSIAEVESLIQTIDGEPVDSMRRICVEKAREKLDNARRATVARERARRAA